MSTVVLLASFPSVGIQARCQDVPWVSTGVDLSQHNGANVLGP